MGVRDRTELEIRTTCILSGRTWDSPVPDIVVSGRYKGQCPTRPARFPTLVLTESACNKPSLGSYNIHILIYFAFEYPHLPDCWQPSVKISHEADVGRPQLR